MKKIITVILLLTILFSFSACGVRSVEMQLLVAGHYGVPFLYCTDFRGYESSTATVIERDEYGRILFTYTADLIVTNVSQKATAIMICQKAEYDYVYYYEDICFYMGEPDEDKTAALKERNDWGQPLVNDKMTVRDVNVTFDLCLNTGVDNYFDWKNIKASIEKELSCHIDLAILDMNEAKTRGLAICGTVDNDGNYIEYFAIFDRRKK